MGTAAGTKRSGLPRVAGALIKTKAIKAAGGPLSQRRWQRPAEPAERPPRPEGEFQPFVPAEQMEPFSRRRNQTRPGPAVARVQRGSGVAVNISRRGPDGERSPRVPRCWPEPGPPSRSPRSPEHPVGVPGRFPPLRPPGARPDPRTPSPEVGLGRALADPLPAARLYKSPAAAGRGTRGCPGRPRWRSSAVSSCPRSAPAAPCACWAPSWPWMCAGERGAQIRFSPLIPLTKARK